MRDFFLFLRRIAGIFALVFGGRQVWEARQELKRLNTALWASRIISDGVLLNEIPSPSEEESLRMKFLFKRLGEFGISNVFTDEWGNVLALFPAFGPRSDFVLLVAEVGDANYTPLGNSVQLSGESASGQGLGERSLGAAALLVFAEFAQTTGFHLEKNLLILFTRSSSVDEKEEAFRHFLTGWTDRISSAIVVHGTKMGVIETKQIGSYRLSVSVETEHQKLPGPPAGPSASVVLGAIAAQVGAITWAPSQTAFVNLARMQAGVGFGHWATHGELDIEIWAEDDSVLEAIKREVTETVEKAADGQKSKTETLIRFRRSVGDSRRNEFLINAQKASLVKIRVTPEMGMVSDKVSLLNEMGIPAIGVGITRRTANSKREEIELAPIALGFRQLLLVVEGAAAVAPIREEALA